MLRIMSYDVCLHKLFLWLNERAINNAVMSMAFKPTKGETIELLVEGA